MPNNEQRFSHMTDRTTHELVSRAIRRRTFLVAGGLGFAGLSMSALAARGAALQSTGTGRAKSTILFFLCGGSSHLDTWDMKPEAALEFRGDFKPIATTAPDIQLCEHLPRLAKQAHHLAIVRSLGHYGRGTGDHHAGYYYNLTGHAPNVTFRTLANDRRPQPTDWPYIGCVVGAKRPVHPYLPNAVTLPHKPSRLPYTRPGQFAALLGVEHDPLYVDGNLEKPMEFSVPALELRGDLTPERVAARRSLLEGIDAAERAFDDTTGSVIYSKQQEKAFSLLTSSKAKQAFDLAEEPESLREKYGQTVNGMSLLMARRLVEAGVPFITVFWKENMKFAKQCKSAGGWDTHGNNFNCLRDRLLPEFDRGFATLIEDLDQRGRLDDTLLVVNSEMGRKPQIGDVRSGGVSGGGRDHWTNCMSVLLAGGGIRGGQVYGSSDPVGEFPANRPVAPEHIAHTIYHAMGIADLTTTDLQGRPLQLLPEGRPLTELF